MAATAILDININYKNYFWKIVLRVKYYVYDKLGLNQFNKMEVLPKYGKINTWFSNKSENANMDCDYDVIGLIGRK